MKKVVIRQQPAAPPVMPQILVLSDQMLSNFQHPDKYIKCLAMSGYSMRNYVSDVQDQLIDLNYEHVVIYLGTMQLGVFDAQLLCKDVIDLMQAIRQFNDNAMVTFVGIVPRPMDYQRSKVRCATFNKTLLMVTEEIRKKRNWNVGMLDVLQEFLDRAGGIRNEQFYVDQLYLSVAGGMTSEGSLV